MRQRGGFTLIELAIVLVIIGLLIGGILAAQSMISTAKINATVRQIGQFDAAVMNFKSKYNYLPGDAPAFGGNGNGLIDLGAACIYGTDITAFACEIANFWSQAESQEFKASTYSFPGVPAESSGANKNVPAAKIGKSNDFVIASALSADSWHAATTNPSNYYAILDSSNAQTGNYNFHPTTSSNSAVEPAALLALDTKMDDGVGNTGNVLSGAIGESGFGTGAIVVAPLATCSNGSGVYQIQNSGYECTPLIRIGGSVGDPQ
ncbi:MAG: hypothetical protein B7Z37_05305 [Verrucomicrobia bacterium 12-59-8]|nr:MAG: hypothetical protein B7Z37_05305 [Verrucomicrobia bacterium 12-59-8]